MEEQKIRVMFVIEMMGRPPEHLVETMEQLIERLGKEKGVKVIDKKIHDPIEYEEKENDGEKGNEEKKKENEKKLAVEYRLYTTFAEIEAEFEGLGPLFMMTFNYMPSNIEIISPESFVLKNSDFSSILTGIVVRLHRYDEIAKKLNMDNQILQNQLRTIVEKINQAQKGKENKEPVIEKEESKSKEESKEDNSVKEEGRKSRG